jgi:hypothetical protein
MERGRPQAQGSRKAKSKSGNLCEFASGQSRSGRCPARTKKPGFLLAVYFTSAGSA